jgi:hypothetical protein
MPKAEGDRPATDTERRASEAHARLSASLEAALVRELRDEYTRLNALLFEGLLRPPLLVLSEAQGRLGRFDAERRTLELGRALVLGEPWPVVLEVLKHEMAHQYVIEVLLVVDEGPHGATFKQICRSRGIDWRAAGTPDAARTEGEARVLERVARLLALAESTSQHEAEAAMNAAQRLMLKYNLENAVARAKSDVPAYRFRVLGEPTGRVTEAERTLSTILQEHFFVQVIWVPAYRPRDGKRGSVLEVSGTESNLELASYVHSFLTHAAESLWRDHKKHRQIRGDRDRRTFLAGVMAGFLGKLNAERRAQVAEGLVWVGDADLRRFWKGRHPHVVTVRYGGGARNEAHAHGRAAGSRLVINKPMHEGPSGGVKLLGR